LIDIIPNGAVLPLLLLFLHSLSVGLKRWVSLKLSLCRYRSNFGTTVNKFWPASFAQGIILIINTIERSESVDWHNFKNLVLHQPSEPEPKDKEEEEEEEEETSWCRNGKNYLWMN